MLVGAFAATCYALSGQPTTHEFDVYLLLPKLHAGDLTLANHPLALRFAHALESLLGGAWPLHERLKIVCGVCVGVAVGVFTHATWVLHRDLRTALAVGAIYASLPATVHFATMFELQALFLPFAAAATWMACRAVVAPARGGLFATAILGVLTALATAMHATGHLLVPVLACWLALEWRAARLPLRAIAGALACFVATHAAANVLVGALASTQGAQQPAAAAVAFLATLGGGLHDTVPMVVGEWLWPFAPVSVLWLAAWFRDRGSRPLALALGIALLAQLALCQWMLITPIGYVLCEFGAYQLPIALFAVVLTVRSFPGVGRLAVLAAALAAAAWAWTHPSKPVPDRAFGRRALQSVATDRWLLGRAEFDGVFEEWFADPPAGAEPPRIAQVPQFVWFAVQNGVSRAAEMAVYFQPAFDRGLYVVVTPDALAELRAWGGSYAELVDRELPRAFELREVRGAGPDARLLGYRVEPRQ